MLIIVINELKSIWRGTLTASVIYWSEFLAIERRCIVFAVRYELNKYCKKHYIY
jgi:hypothetical protein